MFTWLCALGILLVVNCEALSSLPNVTTYGNPDNNLHDQGIKSNVLKFTRENNDTTVDQLPNCRLRMRKVVSNFSGATYLSCPRKYRRLSCGILNVGIPYGSWDLRRRAFPSKPNQCYCADSGEAQCVTWCVNRAVKVRVARSKPVPGTTNVYCPSRHKVCTHSLSHFLPRRYVERGYATVSRLSVCLSVCDVEV